jgi:serine/threonine-protein kinase
MIDVRGEPVVMDFGLARRDDDQSVRLTASGQTLGTLSYMPPEQLRGELRQIGPHSDIYSLGVILYELLTGRLPFDGSPAEIAGKILTSDPPPIAKHQPVLAGSLLDDIVKQAMSKSIDGRFASMAEFAAALSSVAGAAPAPPPAPSGKKRPFSREAVSVTSSSSSDKGGAPKPATKSSGPAALIAIVLFLVLAIGAAIWKVTQ